MSTTITVTETITKEVQAEVNAAFPTETAKAEAVATIAASFDNPEIRKKAYEDVKKLAATIQEIRETFQKVDGKLLAFDSEQFMGKDGALITLRPKWKTYIENFESIVHTSMENATEASAFMETIIEVLGVDGMPDPKPSFADLRNEIQGFLKGLKSKEEASLTTTISFTRLADDVTGFASELKVALTKADQGLGVQLRVAEEKVRTLGEQIYELNKQISSYKKATIGSLIVGAVAAAAVVITLSPAAGSIAVTPIVGGIASGKNMYDAVKKRDGLAADKAVAEAEVAAIIVKQKKLETYAKDFLATEQDIIAVAKKIDLIANIWQTINLDMVSLAQSLELIANKEQPITLFFVKKLVPARNTYKCLRYCLETYVEQCKAVYEGEK